MSNYKKDFPIFQTHPDLIYLDSTATAQKPSLVIDGVAQYLRESYANIHRGSYSLSQVSETLYEESKKIVARHIGASSWREIIYSSNSTYALNLLAQSIWRTGLLKRGDTVLVSICEHHANMVPWQILRDDYGIQLEYIELDEDYNLDMQDLRSKLTEKVKIVSLAHVSNTTGQIIDLKAVSQMLGEIYGENAPLFIVDGSQSVPHFRVDIAELGVDALFFTGHKIFSDSGIGVLWAKKELLDSLKPIFSGGGAIGFVKKDEFTHSNILPDKFEPGTPNLTGAVSLLRAFEYVETIGGFEKLHAIENELVEYTLEKFHSLQFPQNSDRDISSLTQDEGTSPSIGNVLKLIGATTPEKRVGVFTFYIPGIHSFDISDFLAEKNICIRAGQHCAEPFMKREGITHSCRMSIHIYNTKEDIDRFFEALSEAIIFLR